MRDYENIPLKNDINSYFVHEVKPHIHDAWIGQQSKIGYEIPFVKLFYKYTSLRLLEDIDADIMQLETEIKSWQTLIHQVITKGLEPSVKMKDSEVDWIGSIPTYWEVKRIKYVCKIKYGCGLKEEERNDGDIDVYGSNGPIGKHDVPLTTSETIIIGRKGSIGELNYSFKPCFPIDTTYYLDKVHAKANLKWLFYCFACLGLKERNQDCAVPGLSLDTVNSMKIPIPPIEEQEIIAVFLDKKNSEIENLKDKVIRQIEKLNEYRATIISNTVTGKVGVGEIMIE